MAVDLPHELNVTTDLTERKMGTSGTRIAVLKLR
jgi:hypothetical protein